MFLKTSNWCRLNLCTPSCQSYGTIKWIPLIPLFPTSVNGRYSVAWFSLTIMENQNKNLDELSRVRECFQVSSTTFVIRNCSQFKNFFQGKLSFFIHNYYLIGILNFQYSFDVFLFYTIYISTSTCTVSWFIFKFSYLRSFYKSYQNVMNISFLWISHHIPILRILHYEDSALYVICIIYTRGSSTTTGKK